MTHLGKILTVGGIIAKNPACCCAGTCAYTLDNVELADGGFQEVGGEYVYGDYTGPWAYLNAAAYKDTATLPGFIIMQKFRLTFSLTPGYSLAYDIIYSPPDGSSQTPEHFSTPEAGGTVTVEVIPETTDPDGTWLPDWGSFLCE